MTITDFINVGLAMILFSLGVFSLLAVTVIGVAVGKVYKESRRRQDGQ